METNEIKTSKVCGIYAIWNTKNQVYIGSSVDIKKRFSVHLANLRNNRHCYRELQDDFNIDEKNIKWEIVEECDLDKCNKNELRKELRKLERFYIDCFIKIDDIKVLNKRKKHLGKVGSNTKDTKKMRQAQRGERNGNASISEDTAIMIKLLLNRDISTKEIAQLCNTTYNIVHKIKNNLRWQCLDIEEIDSDRLERLNKYIDEVLLYEKECS